jgi:hypothetical protein
MPKIKAALTIALESLGNIPETLVGADDSVYAVAWLGDRFFGKSKCLEHGAGSFRFAAENMKWQAEIAADGTPVPLKVALYLDNFHSAPSEICCFETDMSAPYEGGEFVLDGAPCLNFTVQSRPVSERQIDAMVARSEKDDPSRATLRTPLMAITEYEEIRGLYQPKNEGAAGLDRSEYVEGYFGDDNQGRVYLDRDLAGNWKKNVQQIEASVKVTMVGTNSEDECWLRWSIIDVDDPSDDRLDCHWEAGVVLDPIDYDDDSVLLGAGAGDNEGDQPAKAWEQVDGFSLLDNDAHGAKTRMVGGQSKIRYNCPNMAGDNFILKAEVISTKKMDCFAAHTGVMTLWHRLGVEVLAMQGASRLPVEDVPLSFEPACVQLDFERGDTIPDDPFISVDEASLNNDAVFFVDNVSLRQGEKGWFTLISALEAVPAPEAARPGVWEDNKRLLYSGNATLCLEKDGGQWQQVLELPGDHLAAQLVTLGPDDHRVDLLVSRAALFDTDAGTQTRLWLRPHSRCQKFSAGDGSTANAERDLRSYFPGIESRYNRPLRSIDEVEASVFVLGRSLVASLAPKKLKNGKAYFAGKAFLFTHHPLFHDADANAPRRDHQKWLQAIMIGEICHLFGLPDRCANMDFRTPQVNCCTMNYGFRSLSYLVGDIDDAEPTPDEFHFCAKHLKEMRRTHFFEHNGLNWD